MLFRSDDAPLKQIAQVQVGATFAEAHNEAGGVLFFVRQATLMAQPFDAKALTLAGEPVPVVQQIGLGRAHAHFSVTSSGIMAYRIGAGPLTQLTVADRAGASLQKLGEPNKILTHSWSPDESQVAIFRSEGTSNYDGDLWLLDLNRNVETRLTTGHKASVTNTNGPVWSQDGKQLAFASGNSIMTKDVSGATEARLIKDVGRAIPLVSDWTRDGRFLIYSPQDQPDIFALPAAGGDPVALLATPATEQGGAVSPDGHWLAYHSDQ